MDLPFLLTFTITNICLSENNKSLKKNLLQKQACNNIGKVYTWNFLISNADGPWVVRTRRASSVILEWISSRRRASAEDPFLDVRCKNQKVLKVDVIKAMSDKKSKRDHRKFVRVKGYLQDSRWYLATYKFPGPQRAAVKTDTQPRYVRFQHPLDVTMWTDA